MFCFHFRVQLIGWPQTFCHQLGFGPAIEITLASDKGLSTPAGLPIARMSPSCISETMAECGQDTNPDCDHSQDWYIMCEIFSIQQYVQQDCWKLVL